MSRNAAIAQAQRSVENPLVLGRFSSTSLRYLRGTLKAERKVVGYADTGFNSNGGYGGGTFNHWFRIDLAKRGWIIVAKGPPRPKYIQVSAYDLNKTPIVGLPIFDADSIENGLNNLGEVYIPYLNTVMSAQSDLYNIYSRWRIDRGDDRYYALEAGSYLICVSSTRNEPLDYEVGLVVEFPPTQVLIELEDEGAPFLLLQETAVDFARTINIPNTVTVNTVISTDPELPNGFTESSATINSSITVTLEEDSTWFIGQQIPSEDGDDYAVLAEIGSDEYYDTVHDHSISEWQQAWSSQHQDTDRFPDLFIPLTNRP